jgi:hypothetical protein
MVHYNLPASCWLWCSLWRMKRPRKWFWADQFSANVFYAFCNKVKPYRSILEHCEEWDWAAWAEAAETCPMDHKPQWDRRADGSAERLWAKQLLKMVSTCFKQCQNHSKPFKTIQPVSIRFNIGSWKRLNFNYDWASLWKIPAQEKNVSWAWLGVPNSGIHRSNCTETTVKKTDVWRECCVICRIYNCFFPTSFAFFACRRMFFLYLHDGACL